MPQTPSDTIGIILVDHGSRLPAANEMLLDVVRLYERVTGAPNVEPAHMELAEPTIAQAFHRCVAKGATMVVVHPYFLSPGRHSTTDIPRLTTEAAAAHPGVKFHVTAPLGLDDKIAQVIQQRIRECQEADFACPQCAQREGCAPSNEP